MAATVARIELFDRSMSVAAQFFTSVFPILILTATWVGSASDQMAETLDVPKQTKDVLDSALQDSSTTSFGVIGALIVLISATSLSRALTRAFASIWLLPRPKSKLNSAWRWVAVVLTLALSLVLMRAIARFADEIPPPGVWKVLVSLALYVAHRAVRAVDPAQGGDSRPPPAAGGPDLRIGDDDRAAGVLALAAACTRQQCGEVRLHRCRVHLPGLALRDLVHLPGVVRLRSGHRERPRWLRGVDPRGASDAAASRAEASRPLRSDGANATHWVQAG